MMNGLLAAATIWIRDLPAVFLAEEQPEKLAVGEWHFETGNLASLVIGG